MLDKITNLFSTKEESSLVVEEGFNLFTKAEQDSFKRDAIKIAVCELKKELIKREVIKFYYPEYYEILEQCNFDYYTADEMANNKNLLDRPCLSFEYQKVDINSELILCWLVEKTN